MRKLNTLSLKTKTFKKGEIVLFKGEVCQYTYKVISGCLRSYVLDERGKEHTLQFAPEDWIISDMNSFINSSPSSLFIDVLEDTEVLLIDASLLKDIELFTKEELNEQMKTLTRNIIAINKRLTMLLGSTSKERYLDFIQIYPNLAQRISLKLIASYIGVTPEYLSEIRKQLVKKE